MTWADFQRRCGTDDARREYLASISKDDCRGPRGERTKGYTAMHQTIDRLKLDSLFDHLSAKHLAMGSIVIMHNGKLAYRRSVGKDQSQDTSYRIGSITKVFTAVMIYELVDRNMLSLENTLGEFFPDVDHAGQITIADMLGHRSGLANFTAPSTNFDAWKEQPQTHEQLLAHITSQPPDFVPGVRADYNNSNFLLLGYILEKIYNKRYKDLVQERIIQKLGLQNTYYGDHAGFEGKETASYRYSDHQWQMETAVCLDNFGGAGAMISTPEDMCTFITALFDGKVIRPSSLERMIRIEKDGYGWGMFPYGTGRYKGYGHNGKTEGFASSLQYYPDHDLAIGYCASGEVYPKDDILQVVLRICFQEPVTIPTFAPVALTEQELKPFIGMYAGDHGLEVASAVVNGGLVLSVKGQQFTLDPLSDHEFWNVRFGFFFEFGDAGRHLAVRDAGTTYRLHKMPSVHERDSS